MVQCNIAMVIEKRVSNSTDLNCTLLNCGRLIFLTGNSPRGVILLFKLDTVYNSYHKNLATQYVVTISSVTTVVGAKM